MKIVQKPTSNKFNGRDGWNPDMIVCHITEGSYAGAVSWMCNPVSQVSAHYCISRKGEVTQLVPLTDAAWCNGTSADASSGVYYGKSTLKTVRDRRTNANYYTVGIEHEGIYSQTYGALTDAQLTAAAELIAYIRSEVKRIYGTDIPADRSHIVGHSEIAPVAKPHCPGSGYPFHEIISRVKGEKTDETSSGQPYRVQTGAFSNQENAGRLEEKLQKKGYSTYTVVSDGLYKVQVGAYTEKKNAEAMAEKLKTDGFDVYITPGKERAGNADTAEKAIQVGSRVKVKPGAGTYEGDGLAGFVYENTYDVLEISQDRVVIGVGTAVTAAVRITNLYLA
ncbi:N-acetylmuramoyl-L-alanine amidase [Candidatus Soleaferrea massiliensis]|uniref:N-acetylmuramoyl-L-alanine amidase n=1 Tax=Candidatus Soleaferrea massiliensis TaxID=1470354 RepID=UPI000693AA85|nr:N-acetylmuramoyl-L-alanine amidase [Candidatus Soleaferrea massiliensis]